MKRTVISCMALVLCFMLCACQDRYGDMRYDDPDLTYLAKEKDVAPELAGYSVAWTHYSNRDLSVDYLPLADTTFQLDLKMKHIASFVREDTSTPYESWFVIQQVDGHRFKYYDELTYTFVDSQHNRYFTENTPNSTYTMYWITNNPSKPDTCIVKLQSSLQFKPEGIQLYIGNMKNKNFSYCLNVSDCEINTNLGYKAMWQPLSLVRLNKKYYIISSLLAKTKVSDSSIEISNISVIPIDGTYQEFKKIIKKRVKPGIGNTFKSEGKPLYEYTRKMPMTKYAKIKASAKSDAYTWEGPVPFVMSISLSTNKGTLDEVFNDDTIPAIYTLKDDSDNLIPIYAYTKN